MLGKFDAVPMVAVKDIKKAKAFYEGVLGFTVSETEGEEVVTYKAGNTLVNVYRSEFAGTNKATALVFAVGEQLEKIVAGLKEKKVSFEHYEGMPNTTLKGDIHVMADRKVAWFKDPDGNIISLGNR